jgi:hypothetical protein
MLSREEHKKRNIIFWTEFKNFMTSKKSSTGKRINWLNYPTEIKFIYLRLEVDKSGARVCFDIQAKDEGVRAIVWEQMEELKKVLTEAMGDEGIWIKTCYSNELQEFSRIKWELDTVNFYHDKDIEAIYNFFAEKLIAFDDFYQNFKDILILLVK